MGMKNKQQADAIAEERMKLIAPLLDPTMDKARKALLRLDICEQYNVSERTLIRYYNSYLQSGFDGLKPEGRGTQAKYKIPPEILQEAIDLRRELPSRSISTIIQILELEGKVEPGFLKRSTLQDAFAREGYSSGMMKIYQDRGFASQRFQRAHRHDLWQGDIKYGITLNIGGRPTQTYLSCLIDDATRYILHAEFYDTMEQNIVEDTLRKAVTKHGAPRRLYFDNGSQYRTRWMSRACALMGIRLLYAKPRNPQGKGKQERFNNTVDAFLDEISLHIPSSLQELNEKFTVWLSECYHSRQHSALGTTPEIAFKSDSMPPRFIATDVLARAFLHCEDRKADKSGIISFQGKKYDLGVKYAGRKVDVVYDPANVDVLTIEVPGELPFQAHQLVIGTHVAERPTRCDPPRKETDRSRLLDAAATSYQNKERMRQRAISYSAEIEKE